MAEGMPKVNLISNEEFSEPKYMVTSLERDARNQVVALSSLHVDVLLVEDISSYLKVNIL